jgi:hypothetical protein
MSQVRVPIGGLLALVQQLVGEKTSWEAVKQRYVVVSSPEEAEGEEGANPKATAHAAAPAQPVVVEYSTRGSFSRPNPARK